MTQLGEDNCIIYTFHCLGCRKEPGSIIILQWKLVPKYIILHKKHLATVSAQETKAKGKKICVIECRERWEEREKDSFKLSS